MEQDHGIIIGTHYEYPFGGMANRPEWLPRGESDWRRDLAMIKETGFDAIRIRIGFDSSLDEVARLLDICHELGLRVLFGFATFYVNDSFIEEFPDAKIIDRNGKAYPIDQYDYRWQRACIDHPQYRGRRDQLVTDCVTRFGSHPAVMAWDIHNEPSIGPGDHPCYCKHTVAKYQQDLAARFSAIENVNRRWGTTFESFGAVEPPHKVETSPTGFWHDWRDFCARNLSNFLLDGIHIIKQRLPDVPASFNFTHAFGPQHGGQDWWIASQLDYASHSNYPGAAPETTAEAGTRIDLLKAIAPGREVWVAEFQGGPFYQYILWRGIHIETEVNKIFSHGCRALFFYRWEPLMCGPEPWINGMTEPDTYDTERRLATKRVIAELRQQEDLIGSGKTVAPRIGIYLPRRMVWAAGAHEAPLYKTVNGLYGLFVDMGYEVSFVSEPFSADCGLALVAVPFMLELSDAEREALQSYLGRGGRVIAELPMTNLEDCQAAGQWLKLRCREWMRPIYFIAGWSMDNAQGRFGGYAFHDRVLLDDFAGQAVATYRDNGQPALIAAGPDGRLLIPTFPLGRSYLSSFHQGLRETLRKWLPSSLEPDIQVAGVPDEYRALVEARVLESPLGSLLFVMNRSGYDWQIEVRPRGYREVRVKLPTYGAVRQALARLAA
jgi:beta-galactosidase GanA